MTEKMLRRNMPKMCEDKEKILEALSEFISMLDYEYDDGKCRIEGHLFQANGEMEKGVIAWPTSREKILEALSEFISMLDYEYDDGKCRIEGHLFQANGEMEKGVIAWPTSSLPCSLIDFFLGEAEWPKEVKIKINTSMIKISAEELSRMFPLVIWGDTNE